MKRAVFLDRDGTLNEEREYLSDPDKLVLFPGTGAALRRLMDAGFLLFIVTNQSGIGRGYYTVEDMHRVNARLVELLAKEGVRFEKIYFAPEAPDQPSRGRKPSPQFLFDARDEFGVDLSRSFMIGDKRIDLECGWNAGVAGSILVRTGYGAELERKSPGQLGSAHVADGLAGVADWILSRADGEAGRRFPYKNDPVAARVDVGYQSGVNAFTSKSGPGVPAIPSRPSRRVLGVLPARYASTRFPGKPLALIARKPLIQHVVEQCQKSASLSEVIVATDDERIRAVAEKFCRVEMTRSDHPSGSDRIAEVAARCDCDAVVNIQGDEPLIDPAVIDAVAGALESAEMSTAATPIRHPEDYENPNVVKVVVSASGRALYFSRRTIPYLRDAASRPVPEQLAAFPFLKHLGIYGYRRETLLRLVRFPVSPLEAAEKLEQLRALENGIEIAVVKVSYDSIGVDMPEDVARVEELLSLR